MKKIILTAMVFCSVCAMNVKAQTSTSFGVKLNANLMNVKVSELQGGNTSFKPGAAIGGFAKIELSENFALQPELLFNYTETKLKSEGERLRFKYAAVEVPVYALGQFKAGNGKVFAGVGPHIGYGFSIDSRTEKLPAGDPKENKIELDHFYMGGSTIVGYEFASKISVHAGYQMSFDLNSDAGSNVKTQTISLGIGYRF